MMCNYIDFEGVCTITNKLCPKMSGDECPEYTDNDSIEIEPETEVCYDGII